MGWAPDGRRLAGAALLHPPVPGAHVLADVAAVERGADRGAVLDGDLARRLRPVREAAGGVERARLVERPGRARVDAERAGAAVGAERRRRLELHVRDERPEHDPGAVSLRDQERVLAVEADSGSEGGLAIDVLVRVDEDSVVAAEPAPERVQLLP